MPAPTTDEAPQAIKARGAFYTPAAIADFLASWAIRGWDDRVLEPSCGDGVFLTASAARVRRRDKKNSTGHLVGVELEPQEAEKAQRLVPDAEIRVGSFFDISTADLGPMDAVIGNPPYIRYHQWLGSNRSSGVARAAELGVDLSNLSSSWAPFVVHASSFLRPAGRLALVLPAELLHTDYARPVREFLLGRFTSVVVVAFDRPVFSDAQVDAVLLLASSDDVSGLRVIRVRDEQALVGIDLQGPRSGRGGNGVSHHRWSAAIDSDAAALYAGLVASGRYQRLGDIASVDIGFVSGANSYFVLGASDASAIGLPQQALIPTVERPSDLGGLVVRPDETRLLFLPDEDTVEDPIVRGYLEEGVRQGIDVRYKPRHRRRWYRVPLPRQVGDLLLPYMSHHTPFLVVNVYARSTNLVHGVRLREPATTDARAVAACSLSSVWALSAEVEGRAYGGGVLKLETKEAERILVPYLDDRPSAELIRLFPGLDDLVRSGRRAEAAAAVDTVLGIPSSSLMEAAAVFRGRRQGRGVHRRTAASEDRAMTGRRSEGAT